MTDPNLGSGSSDLSDFIAKSDERNAKIQSLGKLDPLPLDSFPQNEQALQDRIRAHIRNLDQLFAEIESFPLVDKVIILLNPTEAYIEFYQTLLPLVEQHYLKEIYSPKNSSTDPGVVKLIRGAQAEIFLAMPIGSLMRELFLKYEQYVNLQNKENAKLSGIASSLEGHVAGKVNDITK